jgi:hypothetical protein
LNSVCKLDAKFNELPIQAIECKLDDLKLTNKTWSDELIDYFEDITYSCSCKKLKLQFIANNSINSKKIKPSVTLYDIKKVCKILFIHIILSKK